jgi:hypothetical protein
MATGATEASATMPSDPPLDLNDPRVKAAMQELGVLPEELMPQESLPSPSSTMTPTMDRSSALRERKRRELRANVAAAVHRQQGKRQLHRSASGLQKELAAHQAGMERMKAVAVRGAQDMMIKELEWKLRMQSGEEKLQKSQADFAALVRARSDAQKEVAKANLKKEEKRQETIEKLWNKQEELQKEQRGKYDEVLNKRATKQAHMEEERQKLKPVWNQERCNEERFAWNKKVTAEEEQADRQHARELQRAEDKHVATQQRLYEQHEKRRRAAREDAAKAARKLADHLFKLDNSAEHEEETKQQLKEKQERAQAKREEMAREVQKACAAKNAKVVNAHAKIYEAQLAREAEQEQEMRATFTKKFERFASRSDVEPSSPTSRSIAASIKLENYEATARHREEYKQIAAENRARLSRTQSYAEQEQRTKFDQLLRHNKIVQDRRRQAVRLRMDLQKGCLTEKDNLVFEFQRAKSCPAGKMVPLIERMSTDAAAMKTMDSLLRKLGVKRPGGGGEEEEEK